MVLGLIAHFSNTPEKWSEVNGTDRIDVNKCRAYGIVKCWNAMMMAKQQVMERGMPLFRSISFCCFDGEPKE